MSEYTNVTVNHSPGPDGNQSAEDLAIIERIKKYGPQDGKDLNYMEYYGIVVDTPVVPAEDIETKVEYEPITSPDIETSVKEVSEEDVSTQSIEAEEGIVEPVNEHSAQHHVNSYSSRVNVFANKSSSRKTKQNVTNNMTKNNETNVTSYSVGGGESEDLIISPKLEKSGENMDRYAFEHLPTEGMYLSTTEDNPVPPFSIQEMNPLATMSIAGFIPLVLGLVVKKFIK